MSGMTVVLFVLGLVFLLLGAELLVRGASRLAALLGISPLVIGLTVVAFGTSSPELAVSVHGAYSGATDVSMGNVLGSNVFNILFVLGLSAVTAPLSVAQQLVRVEVPLMIGATVMVALLSQDGALSRVDGALLALSVIAYTVWAIRKSRQESSAVVEEYQAEAPTKPQGAMAILTQVGMLVIGFLMLVFGSGWLVDGAVTLAKSFGLSERVIALTLIAAGTSLPEVATSVMASLRGERDIAVGNAIGSNIFNLLAVFGFSSLVAPHGIQASTSAIAFDLPVALAVGFACLPIFFRSYTISRWEGGLFLAYYAIYVFYLLMRTAQTPPSWLEPFSFAMTFFVIPLTLITLSIIAFRAWVSRRQKSIKSLVNG